MTFKHFYILLLLYLMLPILARDIFSQNRFLNLISFTTRKIIINNEK